MDYKQTLDYMYAQLPMFTRIGAAALKPDLTNTLALCEALGNPHKKFKTIHIAGTNGKGSTSHMLASILQAAGYKTGLHTSPHLKDFRERTRVNGQMMPEDFVIRFVEENNTLFETIKPSFFEMTVAMCFDYFAKQQVDIAIIETGLGGRLDSTNIILPQLSVITNIGWDHTDLLGDTLAKIAFEKAGIIKPNTPVVIGESDAETAPVFINKATEENAPIVFADAQLQLQNFDNRGDVAVFDVWQNNQVLFSGVECDLTGIYQKKNITTVLAAVLQLQEQGWEITEAHIRQGLQSVKSSTGLMGRWQKLSDNPLTYADTGHNLNGIQEVLKQISLTPHNQLHIVWGMVKDKDITKVLGLLPQKAHYYFCNAQLPRALPAAEMQQQATAFGLQGNHYSTVAEALKAAQTTAQQGDLVFVGGSTFVVAEVV
ncbi:MAG: bifunctional folylpolyglutamate synthase/dihydrofolate synthase [Bacteroidetes bacterium]|nr:MAG: bifunctional folylpolyglutamate synthase/dihydrofolate synthase [Bacteroidota bacterium]